MNAILSFPAAPPLVIPSHQGQSLWFTAMRLYPDNDYLQREWMRAVIVVRKSSKGWLLKRKVKRNA